MKQSHEIDIELFMHISLIPGNGCDQLIPGYDLAMVDNHRNLLRIAYVFNRGSIKDQQVCFVARAYAEPLAKEFARKHSGRRNGLPVRKPGLFQQSQLRVHGIALKGAEVAGIGSGQNVYSRLGHFSDVLEHLHLGSLLPGQPPFRASIH